jgi:ketosteroid isomerase-like protein
MSEENVEIVRMLYAAFAQGDFWAHPEVYDPDVRGGRVMGSDTEGAGLSGEWHGVQELAKGARQWMEAWEDLRVQAEEYLDAGEKVVVLTRQIGRARASGIPLNREMADVYELRDGKVTAVHFYWSRHQALEAARLSE